MSDIGHEQTDKELKKLEKKIAQEYQRATKEVEKKMNDYLSKFAKKDKEMAKKVKNGEITSQEYAEWRQNQMLTGKRWEQMRDTLAQDLVNADKIAAGMINDTLPDAYALNFNYGTYEVESGAEINTSFTLYDHDTVERLMREDPKIIPKARIDIPKDQLWNRQKITSAVTQGILQGESIDKIAKRLGKVTDMDRNAAIRNARTYTTAAENGGRIDSYERANEQGIQVNKMWMATLDDRTRYEHRHLDGVSIPNDEAFEIDGYKIDYPGDPDAEPEMIYNCRCTLVADIKGVEYNDERNDSKLGEMTYDEWKHALDKRVAPGGTEEDEATNTTTETEKTNVEPNTKPTRADAADDWFEYENANLMSEYIKTGEMPEYDINQMRVPEETRERLKEEAELIQAEGATTKTEYTTLYRGMVMEEAEVRELFTPGESYTLDTLTAATTDEGIAKIYANPENSGTEGVPVILEIEKPDGIYGFDRDGTEVVLPKMSDFEVKKNYMDEDGVVHVDLYAPKGNNIIAEEEKAKPTAEEPRIKAPEIGETKKFETSREADEYFRGSTYESRLGNISKTRGYGVSEEDDKPTTKWQNKLTWDQTTSLTDYTGSGYQPINNYLRGTWDKAEAKDAFIGQHTLDQTIKYMDSGLAKAKLDTPITVYRTCEREFLDKLQEGSIFHDEGYGSTSVLPIPVASGDVHIEIDVPAGKGVGAYMEGLSWKEGEEFEFLLARGADYYVEKIEEREDGIYVKAAIAGFTR